MLIFKELGHGLIARTSLAYFVLEPPLGSVWEITIDKTQDLKCVFLAEPSGMFASDFKMGKSLFDRFKIIMKHAYNH